MSATYTVYAANAFESSHISLVASCGAAKNIARQREGVLVTVQRDGVVEARYLLASGVMKAWVR